MQCTTTGRAVRSRFFSSGRQLLYKAHPNARGPVAVEEVIEQLRELNEPVPVPLELPDDELLVEIEEQLLINLPFELREFLLKVSDVVYGRLEPVTATDPQSHTYLPEVASVAWDLGVPRDLVPICQDGRDYYVVDLEGEVLLWSGEEGDMTDESWDSVWHWARDVWLES